METIQQKAQRLPKFLRLAASFALFCYGINKLVAAYTWILEEKRKDEEKVDKQLVGSCGFQLHEEDYYE